MMIAQMPTKITRIPRLMPGQTRTRIPKRMLTAPSTIRSAIEDDPRCRIASTMSKTPSTMAQTPITMARTTAVAIGANKAMRPKMIPRTPRIMAKIQIFFAKLGKPAAVFGGTVAT